MSAETSFYRKQHLLGIKDMTAGEIEGFLKRAQHYADLDLVPEKFDCAFRKLVMANLFIEPSTRTQLSFEMAAHRLGIKPLNFNADTSSLKKGESLMDTVLTVNAMGPDIMVIRQPEDALLAELDRILDTPIINAGNGTVEHPTQALLDALTIRQKKEKLKGLNVAVIGDIDHSRVARSNFYLLTTMGANVRAFGPEEFLQKPLPKGVYSANSMDEALDGADVIMMLRVQTERMKKKPSLGQYFQQFGLGRKRLDQAKPDAIVMHPGPINRGVEIADEVADDPEKSLILDQVKNGVAVRMAILDTLTAKARKENP